MLRYVHDYYIFQLKYRLLLHLHPVHDSDKDKNNDFSYIQCDNLDIPLHDASIPRFQKEMLEAHEDMAFLLTILYNDYRLFFEKVFH